MRIVINTAHQRFGGAIQVALSFIDECLNFPENEYYIWVGSGINKSLNEEDFPDNFHFTYFDFGKINFLKSFKINQTLKIQEKIDRPEIIISTSGPSYFHSNAPQIIGFNLGLYIYPESPYHKIIPFKKKLQNWLKKQIHYYFFKRDAIAYVVQTEDVNKRVQKALNTKKVFTVTNTYNRFYEIQTEFSNKLPAREKSVFRFITISAYYPHKNLEIIPQVLNELHKRNIDNVQFILTLKDQEFKEHIGEHKNIINIGPVKPAECPSLYKECDFLFLPTLAECFSASYPEAMKMNKPIVTTDLGFARSICGDAATYFKPMNAKDAAEVIRKLITDPQLQDSLIEHGKNQLRTFNSARKRAEMYLDLCKEVIRQAN